jgi:hypothetical protein
MELIPQIPKERLVRERLAVTQEVGRLLLESFMAKNPSSMGGWKHGGLEK